MQVASLPSAPLIYQQFKEAIRLPAVSAREIGTIIAKYPAMTAKVLQLVNSAFFGTFLAQSGAVSFGPVAPVDAAEVLDWNASSNGASTGVLPGRDYFGTLGPAAGVCTVSGGKAAARHGRLAMEDQALDRNPAIGQAIKVVAEEDCDAPGTFHGYDPPWTMAAERATTLQRTARAAVANGFRRADRIGSGVSALANNVSANKATSQRSLTPSFLKVNSPRVDRKHQHGPRPNSIISALVASACVAAGIALLAGGGAPKVSLVATAVQWISSAVSLTLLAVLDWEVQERYPGVTTLFREFSYVALAGSLLSIAARLLFCLGIGATTALAASLVGSALTLFGAMLLDWLPWNVCATGPLQSESLVMARLAALTETAERIARRRA